MSEPTPSSAPHKTAEGAALDFPSAGAAALSEYLQDCDEHAIAPDVGGAFANAFRAGANYAAKAVAVVHCTTCNDEGAVGNILTAEPCPDCSTPPLAARTAPERIWLDLGVEDAEHANFAELGEVTWSPNNATGHGIAYVRADAQAVAAQAPAAVSGQDHTAMHDALLWLRSALDCKDWHWDPDQRECAELAYHAAPPPPEREPLSQEQKDAVIQEWIMDLAQGATNAR
ncbi:hypothetical protein [Comamonas sp. 4034]|uniref:hypothetical protein n=1 Tax=Comamonas sp. 4034 TaxID=3156455 RepID=UPI003D20ACF6